MEEKWRVLMGFGGLLFLAYFCIWEEASSTMDDWKSYRFHTIETRLWGIRFGKRMCFCFLMGWLVVCVFCFWMCLMEPQWFGWKWPLAVILFTLALPVVYYEWFCAWERRELKPWDEAERRRK